MARTESTSKTSSRAAAPGALRREITVDLAMLTVHQGRLGVVVNRHEGDAQWSLPRAEVADKRVIGAHSLDDLAADLWSSLVPRARMNATFLEQLRTYAFDDGTLRVAYVGLAADLHALLGTSMSSRVFAIDDVVTPSGSKSDAGVVDIAHERIARDAVERVCAKFEYTTVATSLVTEPFTIPELRRVYESVWGMALHPANFRRKVLATEGFVSPVVAPPGEIAPARGGPEFFLRGAATLLHPAMLRPRNS